MNLDETIDHAIEHNPHEPEFHQALREVFEVLGPSVERHPELVRRKVLERLCEPERQIIFRVPWQDDSGELHVNRGFRVEHNSALGPFKGGLRFAPGLNLGVVKFLAFEQTLKGALTGMAIGGAKGGADFDPKGRSDDEIMRFCQSFMTELHRHLGPRTDVPAGDAGVGTRELGYLFGQYKRITNTYESGVLTGKGTEWGGSAGRREATGYGAVYFLQEMLRVGDGTLDGVTCVVSGSGNVAVHAVEKLTDEGALVVACSDSDGVVHDPDGIDVDLLKEVKLHERGRTSDYAERRDGAIHDPEGDIWDIECEVAMPCATQNELDEDAARRLVEHGCRAVVEGANMPCTPEAVRVLRDAGVMYAPGKAANAGGVAASALEMRQNASRRTATFDEVDDELRSIMRTIHDTCHVTSTEYGEEGNYVLGANAAAVERVGRAMLDLGIV